MSVVIQELAATLGRLATPDMKPKALLKAVRDQHPEASKKDVVRAAFLSVITLSASDPGKADRLQDFALARRAGDAAEGPAAEPVKPRKKRKQSKPD